MIQLALFCLALQVQAEPPRQSYAGRELAVREWLALESVDAQGRRPFRPDGVAARYLLSPEAPAPVAGEEVQGEKGAARWARRAAGEDGRLRGAFHGYAEVECARELVALARLEGASTLVVNGEPRAGDLYGLGLGASPVLLREGVNRVFVSGARGGFRLRFEPPPAEMFLALEDATLPTLVAQEQEEVLVGLSVVNASLADREEVVLELGENTHFRSGPRRFSPGAVALGTRRVALRLEPIQGSWPQRGPGELELPIALVLGEGRLQRSTLRLVLRAPDALRVHTRVSSMDGSVQKLALLPPRGERAEGVPLRLLLSLHGAGVDCEGQAGSYAHKPDFAIVAPTNRRPFGFDWQDWGRLDAYEALAAARALLPEVRDEHLYLSGHSMGGHGVWHLAANDPDRFAAIAPSAGWRSFDTYGGRPEGVLRALWHAADAASDTELLISNLAQIPVHVLHGEADDNVPASEGRAMVAALEKAGGRVRSHFQSGAGHWWDDDDPATGAGCVDWKGFFELFRAEQRSGTVGALKWVSVDPGVDAEHAWLRVEQPLAYGRFLRVVAFHDAEKERLELWTQNVRRLALGPALGVLRSLAIDGVELEDPADARAFSREGEGWIPCAPGVPAGEKSPEACGPLKRAFASDFVLVVPTRGSEEERSAALARARYDQSQWSYRANGDAEILTDRAFLALDCSQRNAILYGNRDTNAAWERVVPSSYPADLGRGAARLGERAWEADDLGLVAVGPRADAPGRLFALLCSSGPRADRAALGLALFVSGAGYPDYALFSADFLTRGDAAVHAAGFLDARWRLPPD